MKNLIQGSILAISLIGVFSQANASVLNVSAPINSVNIVANDFGGTLLDSAVTLINNASYNGTARTAVYKTATGLDFYYQFTNNISSTHAIERFSAADFGALGVKAVNVFQTAAAFGIFQTGTESSDGADRSAHVIGFSFIPNGHSKIEPGTTSFTQIIRTDGQNYMPGNFGMLNGFGDNAAAFAVAPVPEPETYALMGMGLVGLLAARRRKAAMN